jgi:hypothetical protein
MDNANKCTKHIEELHHTIYVAGLNYDIWRKYKGKKYRKLFLDADDHYPLFFQTSLHAHFVAVIVALYQLFEKRHDTVNFHHLLFLMKQVNRFNMKEINNIERKIEKLNPLWIKISTLRNKVFGHKTNEFNFDPWQQVKITPNNIKKMIQRCQKLLNDISRKWNRNAYAYNLSAQPSTRDLLKDLKRLRKL